MGEPRISIITPSLNQARFLGQTIQSVIDQRYPNLEHLVMDGGSTDGSVEMIERYARTYPGIVTWRSRRDGGTVHALNEGLRLARGDIVAYINSDDYYLPGAFARVARYFAEHPDRLWVVGNCRVTSPALRWVFSLKHRWPIDRIRGALYWFNTVNQPAVFLRRALVQEVGEFDADYPIAFDYDYWLRCLTRGLPGRIREDLAVFRVHPAARGSRVYRQQFDEDMAILRRHSRSAVIRMVHWLGCKATVAAYAVLK